MNFTIAGNSNLNNVYKYREIMIIVFVGQTFFVCYYLMGKKTFEIKICGIISFRS